jgi:nucleoside-diphosphate-sugar epimerase
MRILIAGAAGYIGSRLTPFLQTRGHDVVALDLLWFGNTLPESVPVLKKDVFSAVETDLRGFDAAIFLAGLSNDPMAEYSPAMNFVMNGAAPSYLAYIAKQAGVPRYIYAGSCSVYGFTGDDVSLEESPTRSVHPYGISKLKGEFASLHMDTPDFAVTCFRQGTVSGWSPRMRFDLLLNTMYAHARGQGVVTVNNPSIQRPLLAITDALEAYAAALEAPVAPRGIFNLASMNLSVGEAAERVQRYLQERHNHAVEICTKNISDARNYRVSSEKAMRVFGWKPRGTVESILEDLASNLPAGISFDDDQYHNVRVFKKLFPSAS